MMRGIVFPMVLPKPPTPTSHFGLLMNTSWGLWHAPWGIESPVLIKIIPTNPSVRGAIKKLVPPTTTGLGLAIMEATAHSMLGFYPTPLIIKLIAGIMPPFFLGMLTTAIGAYLYTLAGARPRVVYVITSIFNTLAWEDVFYWVVMWQTPRPWVFYFLGLGIPYVVYHGVPVVTVVVLALSTWVLIRHTPAGGSK